MLLPGLIVALALAGTPPADTWDRADLVRALDHLARTGEPHHIDHDDGQQLWAALKPALATADADLRALATRAAAPIVAQLRNVVVPVHDDLWLAVRATTVLPLPWQAGYTAVLFGSVDGGAWRELTTITSGESADVRLTPLLSRAALTPGVHTIAVRARMTFELHAPTAARETRVYPPIAYAIWDPARLNDPIRADINTGRHVLASALEAGLPDWPLRSWLASFAQVTDDRVQPCWMREPTPEARRTPDVCLTTRASGSSGTGADVWVRIGHLKIERGAGTWTRDTPTLVAAHMLGGATMPEVPLWQIPTLLASAMETWPSPTLVVRPGDIRTAPAAPLAGDPGVVTVRVSNPGTARAIGVEIDVVVAADEQHAVDRRFIRDIEPGGFVDVEMPVVFIQPYAIVNVLLLMGDHGLFSSLDTSLDEPVATLLINRTAMPPALLRHACGSLLGTSACGG